jgi:hypothetical protein
VNKKAAGWGFLIFLGLLLLVLGGTGRVGSFFAAATTPYAMVAVPTAGG